MENMDRRKFLKTLGAAAAATGAAGEALARPHDGDRDPRRPRPSPEEMKMRQDQATQEFQEYLNQMADTFVTDISRTLPQMPEVGPGQMVPEPLARILDDYLNEYAASLQQLVPDIRRNDILDMHGFTEALLRSSHKGTPEGLRFIRDMYHSIAMKAIVESQRPQSTAPGRSAYGEDV